MLLKRGRHEYRFVADGEWLDDPAAEQRIANAFRTENCVKFVAGKAPPNIAKNALWRRWGVGKSHKMTEDDSRNRLSSITNSHAVLRFQIICRPSPV